MASGKKSFVLYSDLLVSIEHLTNEEKGILFNHLLEYVNDKNPVLEDRLLLTAWKPIEMQLKRDLKKFEEVRIKRSEAGKKSAEIKAQQNATNSTSVEFVQHRSTNSTDNVNDNVNVNDNDNVNVSEIKNNTDKPKIFNFKTELINLSINEQTASDYISQRNKKRASNTETALNILKKEIDKSGKTAQECIEVAIERGWIGYKHEWDKATTSPQTQAQKVAAHVHVKTNKNYEDGWQ